MSNAQNKIKSHLKRKAQKKGSEHEEENKPNRMAIGMSIFILFIMVGSTFGFIYSYYQDENSKQNFEYNGFELKTKNNMWTLDIGGKVLDFYNHPSQLESINLSERAKNELVNGNPIVVTFDPEDNLNNIYAQYLDQVRLDLSLSINAISAVTNKSELYAQLPQISCANKTVAYNEGESIKNYNLNIIYLKKSNETKITVADNGCVILESQTAIGFLELKDRLVYGLFDVMK